LGDSNPWMGSNINQPHKGCIYGHSGSSGVLIMLVTIAVPVKLPARKRCGKEEEEEKEEKQILGRFYVFLK